MFFFTPDKSETFEKQVFRMNFEAETKKVSFLTNETNNILQKGDCFEPIISM